MTAPSSSRNVLYPLAGALTISVASLAGCGSDAGTFTGGTPDGGVASGTGGASTSTGGSTVGAGGVTNPAGGSAGTMPGRGGAMSTAGVAGCTGASCGIPNPGGKAANEPCSSPTECLTGRCEPAVTGTAGEICLGACFADGVACTKALDCCSTGCHNGVCGSLCTLEGENCDADADCCSNICNQGRCDIDRVNRDCRPTGEDCTSGTGRGCCNECNDDTGRCDFGPGTCFGQGVACTAGTQCCNGSCIDGVCRTPCAENGAACAAADDCCSFQCSSSGQCSPPAPPPPTGAGGAGAGGAGVGGAGAPPACIPVGERCTTAADCCSNVCFGGFCDRLLR